MVGKNAEPVKIEKTTIEKVRATNSVVKTVTTYTKNQIDNAIQTAISLAKQATEELAKTDKGKEITANKYFIHAKHIGGGMLDMCTGIYAGLENAFTTVAQKTKDTTESVLEHKYGAEVKEVFGHTVEAAWEVYSLKGIVKKQALKGAGRAIQDQLHGEGEADKRIYESNFMPMTAQPPQFSGAPGNQMGGSFSMNSKK